jgi:hypothetical protein
MVCVVTSAYVESSSCSAEVRLAQSLGIRLLPVQAEPGVTQVLQASIQPDREIARAALTEALRRVDEVGDPDGPDDRSPFPGLSPFDIDRTRAFFARTHELCGVA